MVGLSGALLIPIQALQLSAVAMLHFQTMKQRAVTTDKVKV